MLNCLIDQFFATDYLRDHLHLSFSASSHWLAVAAASALLLHPLALRLLHATGRLPLLLLAAAIMLVCSTIFLGFHTLLGTSPQQTATLAAAWTLQVLSGTVLQAPLAVSALAALIPHRHFAALNGLQQSVGHAVAASVTLVWGYQLNIHAHVSNRTNLHNQTGVVDGEDVMNQDSLTGELVSSISSELSASLTSSSLSSSTSVSGSAPMSSSYHPVFICLLVLDGLLVLLALLLTLADSLGQRALEQPGVALSDDIHGRFFVSDFVGFFF